jgi:hypothetical protein
MQARRTVRVRRRACQRVSTAPATWTREPGPERGHLCGHGHGYGRRRDLVQRRDVALGDVTLGTALHGVCCGHGAVRGAGARVVCLIGPVDDSRVTLCVRPVASAGFVGQAPVNLLARRRMGRQCWGARTPRCTRAVRGILALPGLGCRLGRRVRRTLRGNRSRSVVLGGFRLGAVCEPVARAALFCPVGPPPAKSFEPWLVLSPLCPSPPTSLPLAHRRTTAAPSTRTVPPRTVLPGMLLPCWAAPSKARPSSTPRPGAWRGRGAAPSGRAERHLERNGVEIPLVPDPVAARVTGAMQ